MGQNSSMYEYRDVVDFSEKYDQIHPYIATPICVISLIINCIISIVLNSNELVSATNFLLVSTSICHATLNVFYLFYIIHNFWHDKDFTCDSYTNSYWWTVLLLIFHHCSFELHSLTIWLAVALALLRCVQLYTRNDHYTEVKIARRIVFIVVSGVSVLSVPNFYAFSVKRLPIDNLQSRCLTANNTVVFRESWIIGVSETSETAKRMSFRIAFESSAIFFYVVPCILLISTIAYLVSTLSRFRSRRHKLRQRPRRACWHVQRHTLTLLVILAFFVVTQLPQGILTFLCSILTQNFRLNVYQSLGEIMELLSILNGIVSFTLYCLMSSLFRAAFLQLFRRSQMGQNSVVSRRLRVPIDSVRRADCFECFSPPRSFERENIEIQLNRIEIANI